MASSPYFIIAILLLSISNAAKAANPKSFFFPAFKDTVRSVYFMTPQLGTPAATFYTSIDITGRNMFINCDVHNSSSQTLLPCHNAECDLIGERVCIECYRADGCNTTVDYDNCGSSAYDPLTGNAFGSGIVKDSMVLAASPSPVRLSSFPYTCLSAEYMKLLAATAGKQGVVGLGFSPMGLVAQLASASKVDRTVSVCLPSSVKAAGAVVVGSLASAVKPISLTRTPLIPYPIKEAPAEERFIGVKSVSISGQAVALNSSLLNLDKDGVGGTKVSTIHPWTVLHPELYGPIVVGFSRKAQAMKLKRVAGVRPFGACFSTASAAKMATGPAVPTIELDLNGGGQWKIYGANSMVNVNNEVMCLGIVKSTTALGPAILIGGHTLEDNLIEMDQRAKTLRFSSSLLAKGLSCSSLPRV